MSATRRLERDRLAADLAAVSKVLATLEPADYFSRVGLEGRRKELEAELAARDDQPADTAASAALFFSGAPVVGSIGIESGFAGSAIQRFQDLVAKLAIEEERGVLGERGPLPAHDDAKLHVTGILRGSFGFLLEELSPEGSMLDTPLKVAVEKATRILEAFSDANEEAFEEVLAATDPRSVSAAREFFSLLGNSNAILRLETSSDQLDLPRQSIERAADRALSSGVEEDEEIVGGRLAGLLPETHMFEIEASDGRGILAGRAHKSIPKDTLAQLLAAHLNQQVSAHLKVRRVLRRGELARQSYVLLGLSAREQLAPPSERDA